MPYNSLVYLVNHINFSIQKKSLITSIKVTPRLIKFFFILRGLGFINNFLLLKKYNYYYISFNMFFFKNQTFFKKLKLISTPTKKYYISLKGLKRISINLKFTEIILSTSRGVITHTEALKYGIGGLLLLYIN